MIVIVDYKMGNVGSILNMLKKIGIDTLVSSEKEEIKKADKLILPGVGSFDAGINSLKQLGLIEIIKEKVTKEKTPILGICLGMQLFFEKSEEGILNGLGLINGEVKKLKFDDSNNLKIPHMGWNTINILKEDFLFKNMPENSKFYFVHSYYAVPDNKENILAVSNYGYDFASIVRKENIIGVQFHPEKSHKYGMELLKNFIELC